MPQSSSATNRIAKNAVALYIRSFIVMLISLYTSRVILRVLGVENLGIYNVVGGVVMMFAFLDGAQTQTYQRYYNYAMGRPDKYSLTEVFSTAVNVQTLLAASLFLLTEVVGLYLLYNHLVIPDGRQNAAFWVFQFSIVTLIINTISIPYSALIVSNENFRAFAYIDIANVILKLLIVFLVERLPYDRLIAYALLIVVIQVLTRFSYSIYCKKKYHTIRYKLHWNGALTKDIAGFSGWIALSSIISMLFTQGVSIIYNMFFGVVANAAIGIANQVRSAVLKLTNNLTLSFGPQLVTNYAGGNLERVNKIWTIGNKCALGLFSAIAIPIIIDADYILALWLKEPPQYTTIFLRLILIENIIRFFAATAPSVVRATGKIKSFELITNAINIIAFIFIVIGFYTYNSISLPYIIMIINSTVQVFYSVYVACKRIDYSFIKYIRMNTGLLVLALGIAVAISIFLSPSNFNVWILIVHSTFTAILVILSLYFIALLPGERSFINLTVLNFIKKKWRK